MKSYVHKISEKETRDAEKSISNMIDDFKTYNASLGFEIYSNEDVCNILNVTYNLLTEYRNNGLLNYSRVGDKYWYTSSDIQDFIKLTRID